jgi:threonyl-tRNA synthetase
MPQPNVSVPQSDQPMVLPRTHESENLKRIRHTFSHVMAMAVQRLFPKAQVTIGPWIDYGFYYDFDHPEPFTEGGSQKDQEGDDQDHQQGLARGAGRGEP